MIAEWTTAERLSLADLFEGLTDAQWAAPSLCAGWTAHDVAAHLTLSTRTGWREIVPGAVRARFSFDRMEFDFAKARAARFGRAELVAQLRETASSSRRTPGSTPLDTLADALVHGQDVARPLGLRREMPVAAAAAALGHVVTSSFYGARKRFRGLRLVATDVEWSSGEGPRVRGPVADLLMVATGRRVGLAALTGAEAVAARM